MLVKLGDSWLEPSEITYLAFENTADENKELTVLLRQGRVIHPDFSKDGNIDDLANIVNEALLPQQSWGETISEQTNETSK